VKHKPLIYKYFFVPAIFAVLLASATAQAAGPKSDPVLATVGSEKITEVELGELAAAVPERFRHFYMTPEGKKKTVDYIVNIYVMSNQAEKEGLNKTSRFLRLTNFMKKDLLARLYLEKMTKKLPVPTEADAKAFYDKNIEQYTQPSRVHLHHILLKTEDEAKKVLKSLKKGAKFADVASKKSTCPSRYRGGDLDWLPKGSLVTEVEEAAFKMDKGQITGPVKSMFGYHVLMLEDKKPPRKMPFEEVKGNISDQLKFKQQQDQYEKLASSLRKKMDVKISLPEEKGKEQTAAPAAAPKK
jgi:peptidyl-prolyl cis-trans isomerase C